MVDDNKTEDFTTERCQRCDGNYTSKWITTHGGRRMCSHCCWHSDNGIPFDACPVCRRKTNLCEVHDGKWYCSKTCIEKFTTPKGPFTFMGVVKSVFMLIVILIVWFIVSCIVGDPREYGR